MTQDKPPTAAKIHAVLRKAGFKVSKSQSTRVRGWHRTTKGYKLSPVPPATSFDRPRFILQHCNDSQGYGRTDDPAEMLAKYAGALSDSGIAVELRSDLSLIVG